MWLILSWAMSWFFSFADFRGFWELRRGVWRHDDERAENDWLRTRMGVYAEGNYKVEEYTGRAPRATIQLWRLHDALHVSISTTFGFCICQHLITCSSYFFLAFLWYCFFFFFFKKICLQNHLQHVHAKASPWLLSTALWQVPGVFWRIHICHGRNLILLQSKYICQMYFAYSVWAKFNLSLRFAITE